MESSDQKKTKKKKKKKSSDPINNYLTNCLKNIFCIFSWLSSFFLSQSLHPYELK